MNVTSLMDIRKFLILLIVFSLCACQKTDSEIRESNFSLYATLDPLLGYSHSEKYVPNKNDDKLNVHFIDEEYSNLKNGFVKMVYNSHLRPIKITILGSSSTDPFLFNGNWPLALHHKMVENKIPHVIYNGAVSGYNSTQLLIKLIRDVFWLDRPDIVIVYHGGNDFIANKDITERHPAIHPYAIKLFDHLRMPSSMSNLWWSRLTSIFSKRKYDIQLGVAHTNYMENSIKNINYMNLICLNNKVSFMHIQEVYQSSPKQLIADNSLLKEEELNKRIATYLAQVHEAMKPFNFSVSIQSEIPLNKKIFYDSVHLNQEGNKLIASSILKKLIEKKLVR